ncbi:MAG TPA: hypothetical protein VF476_06760 [Chitinophagaceae bacterium]
MKKLVIGLALLGGVTAIAFASFSSRKTDKQVVEKKAEKKKECKRSCLFS